MSEKDVLKNFLAAELKGTKEITEEDGIIIRKFHLEEFDIPEGVTTINAYAFDGCWQLESVTIPTSVKTIEKAAFRGCGLKSVTIPEGVWKIGEQAFSDCMFLSQVVISDSVTTIGRMAFYNCRDLDSITIPEGVESIDDHVFGGRCGIRKILFQGKTDKDIRDMDGYPWDIPTYYVKIIPGITDKEASQNEKPSLDESLKKKWAKRYLQSMN